MLKIDITVDMLKKMKQRHAEAGDAYKGASIGGGKGRIWGFLGEEVVLSVLTKAQPSPCKDFDLIYKGFSFEVKTKTRSTLPRSDFDASVDYSASHQKPDFYVFVQIVGPKDLIHKSEQYILNYPYKEAYIIGVMSRQDFYKRARFFSRGSVDPSNGIKYRDSIFLVKYSELLDGILLSKI